MYTPFHKKYLRVFVHVSTLSRYVLKKNSVNGQDQKYILFLTASVLREDMKIVTLPLVLSLAIMFDGCQPEYDFFYLKLKSYSVHTDLGLSKRTQDHLLLNTYPLVLVRRTLNHTKNSSGHLELPNILRKNNSLRALVSVK